MSRTIPPRIPLERSARCSDFRNNSPPAARWHPSTTRVILTPTLTWEQRAGFTRLRAFAITGQAFSPSDFGINLLGSKAFPQIQIQYADPTLVKRLGIRPARQFRQRRHVPKPVGIRDALCNWVKGRHTLSFGVQWDHTQLNIINQQHRHRHHQLQDLPQLRGRLGANGHRLHRVHRFGESLLPFRHRGAFVNDNYKLRSNLTVTLGLRWDFDGPLSEKYGKLTAFNAQPVFVQRCHRHHHQFRTGNRRKQQGLRHTGRQRLTDETAPMGICAARWHRLDAHVRN